MASDHESRLAKLRLSTLVRSHQRLHGGDDSVIAEVDFSLGAAGIIGASGWVLVVQSPERGLGPALLWMDKYHLAQVNVIVESGADVIARRARLFDLNISVWSVVGDELIAATPAPVAPPVVVPARHLSFSEIIEQAGATVVSEHGVLAGEILGLEVCRVVDDPLEESGMRLAIGVGAHDRELFHMVNGNSPTLESLAKVVREVLRLRRQGAEKHPLNQLGAERLFREILVAKPQLVGADRLNRAEPPVARLNLKDPIPCVATGQASSAKIVVVCSAIIDTDLVPFAADARLALEPNADLVLAVAPNNVLPSMKRLANALHHPARFVVVAEFRR
ncbi:MAG: hypothetical protein AAB088_04550 [Actinomycetota bacterium]